MVCPSADRSTVKGLMRLDGNEKSSGFCIRKSIRSFMQEPVRLSLQDVEQTDGDQLKRLHALKYARRSLRSAGVEGECKHFEVALSAEPMKDGGRQPMSPRSYRLL